MLYPPICLNNSEIYYGIFTSNLGKIILASLQGYVCYCHFVERNVSQNLSHLQSLWPGQIIRRDQRITANLINELLVHDYWPANKLLLNGSNFEIRIWQALQQIALWEVISYTKLAEIISKPKAARAVAKAIAANNIAWFIPCHRVIPNNGGSTGKYKWSVSKKQKLIQREKSLKPGLYFPELAS